jgi:hypothetical protein
VQSQKANLGKDDLSKKGDNTQTLTNGNDEPPKEYEKML